jgi:MFS family permease
MNSLLGITRHLDVTRRFGAKPRALLIAFVALNGATGLTLGSFGVLMLALQSRLQSTAATTSLGLSLLLLTMSALAPFTGGLIARSSIRATMFSGSLLLSIGLLIVALTHHVGVYLAAFAVLIGPGVCLLGLIPSTTLVSNWFDAGRARALGFVTMPFGVLVVPPLIALFNRHWGVENSFLLLACFTFVIGIFSLLGTDRPQDTPSPACAVTTPHATTTPLLLPLPFSRSSFVLNCLGLGLLTLPGTMALVHTIPIASSAGISPQGGALLLSLQAGAGVGGALGFGVIADKLGPRKALLINAMVHAAAWMVLLCAPHFSAPQFGIFACATFVIGACNGGVIGLFSAKLTQSFGRDRFAHLFGLASTIAIPFTFGAAPFAGLLADLTGRYTASIAFNIAVLLAGAALFTNRRVR